ncbi:MAG: helix-turn-helix domain-containing protein, partial [Methylibium sp.]|nr:helix-turn-helix domain-containing protein [Methylibium sp.]
MDDAFSKGATARAAKSDGAFRSTAVDNVVESLGARLLALRTLNSLSLEEVARRAEITKSYLSKVERGLSAPSLATVLKLARALGLSSGQLLGDEPRDDEVVVVKAADRVPFSRTKGRAGYLYEAIAAHRPTKAMMPFIMRPPLRSGTKLEMVTHAGEELIFVVSGEMEIVFAGRSVVLQAGDSVYFNASVPHR